MAEPDNLVLKLLSEMRTDSDRKFDETKSEFSDIRSRLESMRHAINGESVLGRYAAAEVEDRLEALERRIAKLESGH